LDAPPPYATATQSTARLQEFYTRTDAAQPSSTVDWCQNGIASELIWGKLTPVHAAEPACRCRTAVEHLVDARCRCATASVAWLAGVGEVDADAVVRICDELKWWWWWIWSTRCRIPRGADNCGEVERKLVASHAEERLALNTNCQPLAAAGHRNVSTTREIRPEEP